jgi:septal ring factor EnvC (AmiA/AmiB activator)
VSGAARRVGTLGLLLVVALVVPALPGWSSADEAEESLAADRKQWRSDLRDARAEVDAAHARQRRALNAYKSMRHRRKKRGEAKREVLEELRASEADIPKAEAKLEALRGSARSAGVPPGWLRGLDSPRPTPAASADE